MAYTGGTEVRANQAEENCEREEQKNRSDRTKNSRGTDREREWIQGVNRRTKPCKKTENGKNRRENRKKVRTELLRGWIICN
jgi:hypothetical protein